MKRSFTLTICLLALTVAIAGPVNPKRAATVAQSFFASLSGTKGNTTLAASPTEWQFDGVYLFTAAEGGFVLVAADDAVRPILGYSSTGTLDPNDMPPALQQWLQAYQREIEEIQNSQFSILNSQFPEWYALENSLMPKDGDTTGVAPLLTTFWDQTYPYNGYCPGGSATGCAATAQAQVMNFWKHPAFGAGSHSYTHVRYGEQSADFAHTLYDWANMPSRASYNSPMVQKEAVATLMYHCGVSLEMEYDPEGSAAAGLVGMEGIPSIDNSLKDYFGYSPAMRVVNKFYGYTNDQWRDMLIAELDLGHPIVYTGSGEQGGHGFVCDGYDSRGYMHFNFGWSGRGDGYFPVDSISPGVGGVGGNGTYTFNMNNSALLGLVPDYAMRVSDTLFSISRDGEEDSLLFGINEAVNSPWNMTCFDSNEVPADWLVVRAANFDRAGWIHFTATENNSGQERVAVITFTQGTEQRTVRVVQSAFNEEELCPLTVVMEATRGDGWQGDAHLSFESAAGYVYATAQLTSGAKDSAVIRVAPDVINSVWHSGGGTDRYVNYTVKNQQGETIMSVHNAYRNGGVHRITRPCESDGSVGISEASASDVVTVYPNPASEELHIQAARLHKVELMDMSGRLINTTDQPKLDISHLPAGAYFVRITTPDNTTVKRFIKK